MKELKKFEEIPHSGGKVTFSNGQSRYENRKALPTFRVRPDPVLGRVSY